MGIIQKEDSDKAGKLAFIKAAAESHDKSQEDMPWYRSYPSAIPRGIAKGILSLGQGAGDPVGLMVDEQGNELPADEAWKKYALLQKEQTKDLQENLDKNLPIGNKTGPRALERGLKSSIEAIPISMVFGGPLSVPIRSAVGGILAENIKDMGAPDWAQIGVEIAAQLAPGLGRAIPNRIPTAAGRAERNLIQEAERIGLSPEEYALTLNQRGAVKDFTQEIAAKGGRTVNRFDRTRQALSRTWDTLRNSAEAQTPLGTQGRYQFVQDISAQLQNLPAEQRARAMADFADFRNSNMRGEDLINFWQDLNYYIHRGEGGLGTLKPTIQRAIESISPELAQDFQVTNQLYGNFHRLAERMGPNVAESLIRAGENGILVTAITTGNYPLLQKVVSPLLARQLAAELSTNPRLMNLSSRFIAAAEQGSPQIAKKVYDEIASEIGKKNAEVAIKMQDIDFDKIFRSDDKKKNKNKQK